MENTEESNTILGLFLLSNNDMLVGEVDTSEVADEFSVRNPIIMKSIQALVPMQGALGGKPELVPVVNTAMIRIPCSVMTLIDYLGVSFITSENPMHEDYYKFHASLREREKQLASKVQSIH